MEQRLIDANALKYRRQFKVGKPIEYLGEYDILTAPTVDAVPVVRCGECRHWERRKQLWVEAGTCKRNGADFEECDFCSYGEPRTPPAERP